MSHVQLTALSPLDGRYHPQLAGLGEVGSEYGLIRYRVKVEVHWLITLAETVLADEISLSAQDKQHLLAIVDDFSHADAAQVKEIESTTRHDVKAVEYFLQAKLSACGLERLIPWVHFGCTSEDINNLAYALMFFDLRADFLLPKLAEVQAALSQLAAQTADIPMLSRTHGQAASPTLLGKELLNVVARLSRQVAGLTDLAVLGKCNGAVGNFNAHVAAYPEHDWPAISAAFIESLGLTPNAYTTQIEPHDWVAEAMHVFVRINTILIDLNRDFWGYISWDYFSQKPVAGEVGSSTMPHKINPIYFENSEGNLGIANALANHFAIKLPISRFQRDLTDSTVLRNLGSIVGYMVLAYDALLNGLSRLAPNRERVEAALDAHWEVLGEAIQSVMRRHGILDAYEQLKSFTRGQAMTAELLGDFIETLAIPDEAKSRLLALTPATYTGLAADLIADYMQ